MPSKNFQNIVKELAEDYTQSKFEKNYLKEKIQEILEFITPQLKAAVAGKKAKDPVSLWKSVAEDKIIKDWFRKTLEKIERPIVIYVNSKFTNNQYFGTKIIKEALKWK